MTRRRIGVIRDAVMAIAVACILVGGWELGDWLAWIAISDPNARAATGLIERP
jgi:hypothetical protein